ncbi:hypothetical protein F383_32457 [Gossypium arboreum]|uniref:Uncharacterized protein n=1 Tax=Gossypium arboreum TaxID=29729 RepID=A0A0B0PPZ0_GOSAR|nr:hypothetical protein F383_15704 [Gossypium arboreum]KHG25471.1 hypothetical protein F383_32457 [Gossypium arboreum]
MASAYEISDSVPNGSTMRVIILG